MTGRLLLLILRNLRRNLLYTIIVVGGLAIGIITFLAILQWTAWHFSFDKHFEDSQHICRISLSEKNESFERHTARIIHGDVVNQLYTKSDIPEISSIARLAPFRNAIVKKDNVVFYEDRCYSCDPEFLAMFRPRMILGNVENALDDPYKVILSLETAKKYFGDQNPVGQSIQIVHQFSYDPDWYEVTGVFRDFPENSHFRIDLLTSFDQPETYNGTAWVYALLVPGAGKEKVEQQVMQLIRDHNDPAYADGIDPFITPLEEIHLRSHLARELGNNVHFLTLVILFVAGLLVFVLAWFNFTLLFVSQNQLNMKKLICQWQLGASGKAFFQQFFLEFLTIGTFAFALSVLLSILLTDPIRNTFGVSLIQNSPLFYFSLAVIYIMLIISAAATSLFASARLYRKLKIRYFTAHKSSRRPVNNRTWFIRTVIIIEFVITYILLTNLLMIREQVHYSISQQIGSGDSSTIQIPNLPRPVIDDYEIFRDALIKYPAISSITAMMEEPGGMAMDAFHYGIEGLPEREDRIFVFPVDENFVRFYDLEVLAGKDFPGKYDTGDTTEYYILNETAAKLQGVDDYDEIVGRKLHIDFSTDGFIYPGEIIGVVEDFHLSDMRREITPMVLFPEYTWLFCFSIRLNSDTEQGLSVLKETWEEFFPAYPLRYTFTADIYRELYSTELIELKLLVIFTILSVLIAGTGLFALSGFFMQQKMHAAAIRKISGAQMSHIILPELGQYLLLAVIAALIAFPAAWFSIAGWQDNFAYQPAPPYWIFPVTAVFLVLFSWISVVYHMVRLARLNPVEFIRSE
jgi:putative ABC transport system permease protein